ncbi:ABC transporter permease [Halorhabdus sp. CUG00001]|uniref:ABC transporter permease n=1 Tax=Halorhabdus sp. CUG00001 TaxID=2600297 RepID=UPI00131AC6C1|nr:ABC transporter permease subunit [Halorhabdus sp. CUG00001]
MGWLQLARKDFTDARRERQLYYLLGLLGVIGLAIGYFIGETPDIASEGTTAFGLLSVFGFLAPIVALTISQADVVGKRTTGELSVLLTLPFSRRSIVAGSYAGRMAVMTVVLLPAFVFAPLVAAFRGVPIDPVVLAGSFLVIWGLSLIFTAIALGISTFTKSTTVSAGGSFGIFLLFVMNLWVAIPTGIRFVLNGLSLPTGPQPEWVSIFGQLSPFAGLRNLAHPVLPDLVAGFPLAPGRIGESLPWYQEPVFAGIVVLAWIVLPLAIGYYRFQTTDL